MKSNQFSFILFILILSISSCKKKEETPPIILDTCLSLSKKKLAINEKLNIKSCSNAVEATGASIQITGISKPSTNLQFTLQQKTDSVSIGFVEEGKYIITMKALQIGLITYAESISDTVEVIP